MNEKETNTTSNRSEFLFTDYILNEMYLEKIGSTLTIDSLYLFLLTPVSLIGLVLNLNCLNLIFKDNKHKIAIYKYLKVYTLNSIVLCFFFGFSALTRSPRYFDILNQNIVAFYRCKVMAFVITLFYFYGNMLNILIMFERLSNFNFKLKKYSDYRPYHVSLLLLIFCTIVCLPIYFAYSPREQSELEQIKRDPLKLSSFFFCARLPFFGSLIGRIIIYLTFSIVNIIALVIEIILSIISFYYLLKYLNDKNRTLNPNYLVHIIKISIRSNNASVDTIKNLTLINRKLTILTIWLALMSIVCYTTTSWANFIFVQDKNDYFFHITTFVFYFVISLKHSLNFAFVYFSTNHNLDLKNFIEYQQSEFGV